MAGFFSARTGFEKSDIENVAGAVQVRKLFTSKLSSGEKRERGGPVVSSNMHMDNTNPEKTLIFQDSRVITVIPNTRQASFPSRSSKLSTRKVITSLRGEISDWNDTSSEHSVSRSSQDSFQSDNEGFVKKKGFMKSRLLNAALKPISDKSNVTALPHTYANTRKLLIREKKTDKDSEKSISERCFATTAVESPLLPSGNRKLPRIAECKSLLATPDSQTNSRFERKGCCDDDNKTVFTMKNLRSKSGKLSEKMNSSISPQRKDQMIHDYELMPLRTNYFYDSHCHLDYIFNKLRKITGNLNYWIEKYPEAFPDAFGGCFPNFIDPELFVESMKSDTYDIEWIKSEIQNPLVVGCAFGCHPRFASMCTDDFIETLDAFCEDFDTYKVKAIGECGLDFYRSTESFDDQVRALQRQVSLAVRRNLPLVIHCRSGNMDAEEPCLAVLASHKSLSRFHNIHRHCFTGSWRTAEKWIACFPNIYFGYTNGCANFGADSEEMEALRRIPLDRILLETDAPYFKPTSFSNVQTGSIALPGMAISVAEILAKERGLSVDAVIEQTTKNFARMYVFQVKE